MHRATGGAFEGKYIRDMRRATILDSSSKAWGLNTPEEPAASVLSDLIRGFESAQKEE